MSTRASRVVGVLVVVLVALTSAASVARTDGVESELRLRYRLTLAGLPVATLIVRHELDTETYRSQLQIDTVGLVEKLIGYESEAQAKGMVADGDGLVPATYRLDSSSRKKSRRIRVRFDPETGDVTDLDVQKRGKPDRSKVPPDLQKGVIDPLTAFFRLREHVAAARPGDAAPFAAAVFDGRRRLDVEATVTGHGREVVGGRERPVVRVDMALTPLAGFNDNDLRHAGDRETYRIEVLFSDDERTLPLKMTTHEWLITASIELVEECSSTTGCQLAAR